MSITERIQSWQDEARSNILRRKLIGVINSSLYLVSTRQTYQSYARRLPAMLSSGQVQIVSDFPSVEREEGAFPCLVDFEREGEIASGIFLVVKKWWLQKAVADKTGSYLLELGGSLISLVDGYDTYLREGTRILTRKEIDSDMRQRGITPYFE